MVSAVLSVPNLHELQIMSFAAGGGSKTPLATAYTAQNKEKPWARMWRITNIPQVRALGAKVAAWLRLAQQALK